MANFLITLYKCTKSGADTEWSDDLAGPILCVKCWDMASDEEIDMVTIP